MHPVSNRTSLIFVKFFVTLSIIYLSFRLLQLQLKFSIIHKLTLSIILFLLLQIFLGAMTIWTVKNPLITSFHVLNGAIILGISSLIVIHVRSLVQIN